MYIIKIILSLLIFISSTYIGLAISTKYKKRVNDLREFKSFLNIISTKIRYTYEPIREIARDLSKMKDNSTSNIFKIFCTELNNKPISEAWNNSIEKSVNYFSTEDKKLVKNLGELLGKTDVDGQVSQIKQINEFLNLQIDKAEKDRQKNEKLYKSLGMIIGFAVIILLI